MFLKKAKTTSYFSFPRLLLLLLLLFFFGVRVPLPPAVFSRLAPRVIPLPVGIPGGFAFAIAFPFPVVRVGSPLRFSFALLVVLPDRPFAVGFVGG